MDKGAPYLTYLHNTCCKRLREVLATPYSVGVHGANKEYKGKGIHGESSGLA